MKFSNLQYSTSCTSYLTNRTVIRTVQQPVPYAFPTKFSLASTVCGFSFLCSLHYGDLRCLTRRRSLLSLLHIHTSELLWSNCFFLPANLVTGSRFVYFVSCLLWSSMVFPYNLFCWKYTCFSTTHLRRQPAASWCT